MRRISCAAIIMVILLIAGCACRPHPYSLAPFKVGKEHFHGKVKTIALAPLALPFKLQHSQDVQQLFEYYLTMILEAAGFTVVSSDIYSRTWDALADKVGGYYNSRTGKVDNSKLKAVFDHFGRQMYEKYHVDAFLRSSVAQVGVQFAHCRACWHGVSEDIGLPFFSADMRGSLPALSLIVSIEDRDGVVMYNNGAGIQLAATVHFGSINSLPEEDILTCKLKNKRAVELALQPLISASGQSITQIEDSGKNP